MNRLSKNWLPTSIKVMKQNRIKQEKSENNYQKALKLSEDLRHKFNCAVSELPVELLTEKEQEILVKTYTLIGYSREVAIKLATK